MSAITNTVIDKQLLGAVRWLCAESITNLVGGRETELSKIHRVTRPGSKSCDALPQIADDGDGPLSGAPSDLHRGFADGLSWKQTLNTRKE